MPSRKKRLSPAVVVPLVFALYRALCATLRIRETGREKLEAVSERGKRYVFCLWHDELLPLPATKRGLDIVTVVSPSRDGDILAPLLGRLGLRTVRGSSTRGGVSALLGAARLMKNENVHGCVTVDGPQGPRHKAKNGVFLLAGRADALIVPVRILMACSYKAPSWDRFQIPLPFSKVRIVYGEPWKPGVLPEDGTRGGEPTGKIDLDAAQARLEADLARLGDAGEREATRGRAGA